METVLASRNSTERIPVGFGALLGSDGNEGIVGGKAASKATRGSTPSATNSVLAACMRT